MKMHKTTSRGGILQGAKILTGGKRHKLGRTFYEPTVLGDAANNMLIFRY